MSPETDCKAPGAAAAFHALIDKHFPISDLSKLETDMLLMELWEMGFKLVPVDGVVRKPGAKWDSD